MTFEQEPPRPGPRPVITRRRPGVLAPTLITLGVLVVAVLLAAQIWTEALWYDQLGFLAVYRTELLFRAAMFALGLVLMAGAVASSLIIAYRGRPIYAPVSGDAGGLDRYRDGIEPLRRLVVIAIPAGLGLFAGSAASQQWQTLLVWLNREPVGTKDPQFGRDIGFFLFTLPWLQFLTAFLTAVLFLAGLAAAATHYLYGGLRLQGGGPRMTSVARVHLGVLAGSFLLLRAVDYWLSRYSLSTKDSRLITGLTYADANAVLTAKAVLAAIAVIIAALFLVAAVVDRWRMLPLYGVGLLVICAIVIGGVYPAAVQRFQVTPSAKEKEAPYIERNIKATRDAFGLSQMKVIPYAAKTEAEPGALKSDAEQIPGIRLLDPALISPTFRQLQQNKQYYAFADSLDVDRYMIDGKLRDTVIAVRELNIEGVDQRNWVNDHLVYTHGFGVVAAYGNERSSRGEPVFFQSGIPSTGKLGEYEPRIYFGENSPIYSIVGAPAGSTPQELDFPDDRSPTGQQNTTYTGEGGVPIGSMANRLLYAIKFREQNILLSDQVNAKSRIMFDRHPRERVAKVAPYLTLDGDPYPAVVGGRIQWIVDGYTTSNKYPYSRLIDLDDATSDSLTASAGNVAALASQRVNYMRNSVKATVDAYDGSVNLYAWDEKDPVLKVWSKAFKNTVRPMSQISGELMSHLRYPEDMFKVQRQLITRYHVTDPSAFFGGQDFWKIPVDPTEAGSSRLQPPYYLTLQLPEQESPGFSLTSTFIPGGGRNVLTGFLSVNGDAGTQSGVRDPDYGAMQLLQLPRDSAVKGPGQVSNDFGSNPLVSQQLNLLRGGGSQVQTGNLLTLPLGGGLLYVQPVYVKASTETAYPLLQRVLVAFGDEIGFAATLDEALDQVFGGDSGVPSGGNTPPSPGGGNNQPPPTGTAAERLKQALADANKAIQDGQAALKAGDFTAYGAAQKRLEDAIARAIAAQGETGGAPAGTPSPSAPPTPSPSGSP